MIALTDHQLALVMTAASGLPPDKRSVLLERVAARLTLQGRFNDAGVEAAVRAALQGLVQNQHPHPPVEGAGSAARGPAGRLFLRGDTNTSAARARCARRLCDKAATWDQKQ